MAKMDTDCVDLLQWALPRLEMRWAGFRKVRRQVCKRIKRRMRELSLHDFAAYREYLEDHPTEWKILDKNCRIHISRFYRDRAVFDHLRRDILPGLIRRAKKEDRPLRIWSAGCASGEEPYTLSLILHFDFPGARAEITATDVDPQMLSRARQACYPAGSLKDLPDDWRHHAFRSKEDLFCLRDAFRKTVHWQQQDIRREMPAGPFDLVLCRNLVAMYFSEPLQRNLFQAIADRTYAGGWLVLGNHETLPEGLPVWKNWSQHELFFVHEA